MQKISNNWKQDYNSNPPHKSLGNKSPKEYMPRFGEGYKLVVQTIFKEYILKSQSNHQLLYGSVHIEPFFFRLAFRFWRCLSQSTLLELYFLKQYVYFISFLKSESSSDDFTYIYIKSSRDKTTYKFVKIISEWYRYVFHFHYILFKFT